MDVKYMNVSVTPYCVTYQLKRPEMVRLSCLQASGLPPNTIQINSFTCQTGHIQALSVRPQSETGLPGALQDRPEEAAEKEPGKALLQV